MRAEEKKKKKKRSKKNTNALSPSLATIFFFLFLLENFTVLNGLAFEFIFLRPIPLHFGLNFIRWRQTFTRSLVQLYQFASSLAFTMCSTVSPRNSQIPA